MIDDRYARVVAKAWLDAPFKARLLADPKSVLCEMGIDIPKSIEVEVIETTDKKFIMVLPPIPPGLMSEDDLVKAVVGSASNCSSGSEVSLLANPHCP
ncbi:MAG TPA: NHLP leader peptide family RiPP precursor [Gemmataceae bacterium]|nr:NHLP leader peptide family RiPP precursor [Gemmataceae bacterium]